jgi:hypothetical protein
MAITEEDYFCDVCRVFIRQGQWKRHEKSRCHINNIAKTSALEAIVRQSLGGR